MCWKADPGEIDKMLRKRFGNSVNDYPERFLLNMSATSAATHLLTLRQDIGGEWGWLIYDFEHTIIFAKDDATAIKVKLAA